MAAIKRENIGSMRYQHIASFSPFGLGKADTPSVWTGQYPRIFGFGP
jgi:hypothetical protein